YFITLYLHDALPIFLHGKNLTKQAPMNFPFVLKDAESRGGAHVHLITGSTEWHENIARYSSKNLIIQSSNSQHGKDLRVFVVGKDRKSTRLNYIQVS